MSTSTTVAEALEPVIKSVNDPLIEEATRGLRPDLDTLQQLPSPIVRFAPHFFTYKIDSHGGGTRVYLYGTDEFGHSVAVRASGFYPYLYVELVDGIDPRALVNELEATLLHSLALDSKKWAPERKSALAAVAGTIRKSHGKTYCFPPSLKASSYPIVGYEIMPAMIVRGLGENYGYRGLKQRWLLKIYFYSPAMLTRARSLLHGKNSHLTPEGQAKALSRSTYTRDETAAAKLAEHEANTRTRQSMRQYMKAVPTEEDDEDAERAFALYNNMPSDANEQIDELDQAVEEHLTYDVDVGDEWRINDNEDDDVALPHGAIDVAVGGESRSLMEQKLEAKFEATTLELLKLMRTHTSILSRLTEGNCFVVCEAALEFVLRFCIDCDISANAWVEVDTSVVPLFTTAYREDIRNGKPHSADGQHAGFPDASWMLDRAPPGIAPHDFSVRRIRGLAPYIGKDAATETYAQIELRCDFHHIRPVANEAMQESVAQPVRVSVDLEMLTGLNGEFPRPESQSIIKVGIAVPYPKRVGTNKKWRLIVFSLGQIVVNRHPEPDADEYTLCFEREDLMLLSFYKFMSILRPDEFVTFNGHTFDLPYLKERSKVLGVFNEFLTCWSKFRKFAPIKDRERVFESSAHGRHETTEWAAEGVIFLDIYRIVTRNTMIRLKSYSLDTLSEFYLGDHKVGVSPSEINDLHKTPQGRDKLRRYVLKDCMLPIRLDLNQKWTLSFVEKARLTGCTITMLIERGMGIQGKSLIHRWNRRGILIPEEAAAIGIPDAGKYRQCVSYTRSDWDRSHEGGQSYDGAVVFIPHLGVYTYVIATLDFNSLYPSEQYSNNMCPITLIGDDFKWLEDEFLRHLIAIGKYTWETVVLRLKPRATESDQTETLFLTHGALKGQLPMIQNYNLSKRKEVKNKLGALKKEFKAAKAKNPKDPSLADTETLIEVLDQRQNGCKLVANSMYGLDGSKDSFRYSPKIAACVTQCGREHIEYAKHLCERLLDMTLDDPLVIKILTFPGVKSLLLTLPTGPMIVEEMFKQIAIVKKAAQERPLELRQAGEGKAVTIGAAKTAQSLTKFFGSSKRLQSGTNKTAVTIVDEDSRPAPELDADVNIRCVYGDSVTGDTALIVRIGGVVKTCRIDELSHDWQPYGDKQQAHVSGLEVWQDGGFTAVERIIRHGCRKQILRVLTASGVVDCTSDHSLLRPDGKECRPVGLKVKTKLLHEANDTVILEGLVSSESQLTANEAFVFGAFAAFGSCCEASAESACDWKIVHYDRAMLERIKTLLDCAAVVYECAEDTGKSELKLMCDPRPLVTKYRALFYNKAGEKRVPSEVMHAPIEVVRRFMIGYNPDYAKKIAKLHSGHFTAIAFGKQLSTDLWLLARRLGYHIVLYHGMYDDSTNPDATEFHMHCINTPSRSEPTAVRNVQELIPASTETVVYDLQTASHHFHVGPGNLVVHNTDSIFPRFWMGIDPLVAAFFCQAAADFISAAMHVIYGTGRIEDCIYRIEFEKLATSFLIIGKKKYAMMKCVLEGNKLVPVYPSNDPGGPVLSGMEAGKRDTTRYVARGQKVVIRILLDSRYKPIENMRRAVAYIYRELIKPLQENRVDPSELVLTKQLRNYIEAYEKDGRTAPIHVQLAALLAKRAGGRDKPDAPRPGDRLPYIVRRGDPLEPLSSRGEDPVYAFQHGVPIDADYYLTTHVAPSLLRIFIPLITGHRTDVRTDSEREAVTRQFVFGSTTGFCAPADAYKYDFSEYRDKSTLGGEIVRYPARRRIDLASSAVIRELKLGALCVGCAVFMPDRRHGAVCNACMAKDCSKYEQGLLSAFARLQIDNSLLGKERAAIVRRCQKCAGCETQHTEITCQEWNCDVMWTRQANQQAIKECDSRMRDVAESLNPQW